MKIILSRKGFDSGYGRQPSPILPDGTLLSLPIPLENDLKTFSDLYFEGKSYYDIIKELNPRTQYNEYQSCHLDPDIRENAVLNRDRLWKPIFGQADAAQSHLTNQEVNIGDIFLFFGWFRQTELVQGKLRYLRGSPDLHVIYGYFQIGEIYNNGDTLPPYVRNHSHANLEHQKKKINCIYVAGEKLSFDESRKGADVLMYNKSLVLTKNGMSRSKWALPEFFKELKISYHNTYSFRGDYFKSVDKGQEFVIAANEELLNWTQQIIKSS